MDQLSLFLASCLGSRAACNVIAGANVVRDDTALVLLREVVSYYERDPNAQWVDRVVLRGLIEGSATHPKAVAGVIGLLVALPPAGTVSPDNVAAMVHQALQREARMRLQATLEVNGDWQAALHILQDLERPAILNVQTQLDASQLLKASSDRVPIYPAKLNAVFAGGLAPGHCIVVFGRPGAGKTLVVCNLAAGFLMSGKVVLHIMNEESQEALTMRYLSLLCPSQHGELQNLTHYSAEKRDLCVKYAMDYCKEKRNLGNLHIAHGVYSYPTVRELVARLKPDMVIVDQVRHFGRGSEDALHVSLERVTQDLRQHAHEAGFTAVGVTQAGASAEGKPVLDLADIDGAKTGLQGACDAIIGVGKGPGDEVENKRTMSVCRNKISGTITHFPVWLDPQHTLIRNMGK